MSPWYYAFLAAVLIIYFSVPSRFRGYLLLFSSYIFYSSFNPKYIAFILTTTIISFFCARKIEQLHDSRAKKSILALAIGVVLGLLGYTKYWNILAKSLQLFPSADILVPLGISFYTFQSLGYLLDVYRGEIKAEKNFGKYALFVSFFPHLLAGPIEASQDFLPQMQKDKKFDLKGLALGCMMIVAGLFKKIVIADRLQPIVAFVFHNPTDHFGPSVALAAILARYQIYCDFSGYTDIALGSALMFGYKLSPNFNRPFFSTSISEYWQRWHMSLTAWIKKYIFYPLITSPFVALGFSGITIINFLILGLWHGPTANFLLYGIIQALLILLDSKTKHIRHRFYRVIKLDQFPVFLNTLTALITFFILIVPPTILFYSNDFETSKILYTNLLSKQWFLNDLSSIFSSYYFRDCLTVASLAIFLMETLDWVQKKKTDLGELIWNRSRFLFFMIVLVALILTLAFGNYKSDGKFIYMQF